MKWKFPLPLQKWTTTTVNNHYHALKRTQLIKITVREFLDDILNTNSMHIIVRWTGTYNFLIHQASAFNLKFYRLWCTKCNLLQSRGPLSHTKFIPMAKHESESTYICMNNTRIYEKTFFVPLGFGGYLLTIECRATLHIWVISVHYVSHIGTFTIQWPFDVWWNSGQKWQWRVGGDYCRSLRWRVRLFHVFVGYACIFIMYKTSQTK